MWIRWPVFITSQVVTHGRYDTIRDSCHLRMLCLHRIAFTIEDSSQSSAREGYVIEHTIWQLTIEKDGNAASLGIRCILWHGILWGKDLLEPWIITICVFFLQDFQVTNQVLLFSALPCCIIWLALNAKKILFRAEEDCSSAILHESYSHWLCSGRSVAVRPCSIISAKLVLLCLLSCMQHLPVFPPISFAPCKSP